MSDSTNAKIMTRAERQAERAEAMGREAFSKGLRGCDCPYSDPDVRAAWMRGHSSARQSSRLRQLRAMAEEAGE